MMLKSVSLSLLVSGKTYNAIRNYRILSLRKGGKLKVFNTSLTYLQHHCLLAAKIATIGSSCRPLQQGGEISAALEPSKRLASAHFNVNRVVCYHNAVHPKL